MTYEMTGTVVRVGDTEKFASGFTKRSLVIEEHRGGEYRNVVGFTFKKDKCALLDAVKPGSEVKIVFGVDGRDWTDPKTEKTRNFIDLTALKMEVVNAAGGEDADEGGDQPDPDMPF